MLKDKTVLVTGAAKGIGKRLRLLLQKKAVILY